MSRETDEKAFTAVKRVMHITEQSGFPPHLVPLLMLLTVLYFTYVTMAAVR